MANRFLIRLATAGSVDDGKSTLLGRLLLETDSLLLDQIDALKQATANRGEEGLNLALVTDGLRAEREQNITIDVAYRPFKTKNRRFLLADSPGHSQYTRNMATAASTADVVIVLCDASRGLTAQSRRHLAIATLLRVPLTVLAVNKMDAVGFDQQIFDSMVAELTGFAEGLGGTNIVAIPISALEGDNVVSRSSRTPWYGGPSLVEVLDTMQTVEGGVSSVRLPVQLVLRGPNQARFFAGSLSGNSLSVGDLLQNAKGLQSKVKAILVGGEPQDIAEPGAAIAVQIEDELDISRGDLLSGLEEAPKATRKMTARLFWLQGDALRVGMNYKFVQGPRSTLVRISSIEGVLDLESATYSNSGTVALNDIAKVTLEFGAPFVVERYVDSTATGAFILVDPSNSTAAAGCIETITPLATKGSSKDGTVLWMTGLSGAGKSTIADALITDLERDGVPVFHLDGDDLRTGLCSDLGFSPEDRMENIRRAAELAKLLAKHGFVVVCSLISPLRAHRALAKEIVGDSLKEIHVKCDVEECIRRDPKGLYSRAVQGLIPNFTGISAPYEVPEEPSLVLNTMESDLDGVKKTLRSFLGK